MAQTDIQFSILKAEADGVSASVTNALDLKLRQVFDRNGAGAADLYHYCPRNSFNISKSNKLIVTHQN